MDKSYGNKMFSVYHSKIVPNIYKSLEEGSYYEV